MNYTLLLVVFVVCYFLSVGLEQQNDKSRNIAILAVACVVLAFGAGFRDWLWMDTYKYLEFFLSHNTATLSEYSFTDNPYGYTERGFYFLSVVIKTFTKDPSVYFLLISIVTISFLFADIRKYSLYPLLGLCCYVARFFCGRNLVQIRAGLSYLIIVWGLHYVYKKQLWRFLILVFVASLFHQSAWIALPFYFICNTIKLKRKHIYGGLVVAFILGAFFQGPISAFVTDSANDFNVATTYVQGGYVENAKGLANPMIYFQVIILLLYIYLEKPMSKLYKYYYVFRNGYWYSTLILITFCSFTALSGRTSSLFATIEFAIVPSLLFHVPKQYRFLAFMGIGVVMTYFLWHNMHAGFKF